MPTLLKKLNHALSGVYGNTLLIENEPEDAKCQGCGQELDGDDPEGEYCASCQIDRAEYIIEDR